MNTKRFLNMHLLPLLHTKSAIVFVPFPFDGTMFWGGYGVVVGKPFIERFLKTKNLDSSYVALTFFVRFLVQIPW